MDIVAFAVGALSMVGLIIIGLTVIGVVKAYQALKQISNIEFASQTFKTEIETRFNNDIEQVFRRIDEVERETNQHISLTEHNLYESIQHESRVVKSYIDSRIDKLEKPKPIKAKPTDVNPQITDAVTQKVLIKD
jgi:hypothetical protein